MFETVLDDRYAVTDEFKVGTGGPYALPSDLASLPGGGFVAVWYDPAGALFSQVYDANGRPVGDQIALGAGAEPQVTALSDGTFIITWTDTAVRAQMFDESGVRIGDEITVNTTTLTWGGESQITALSDGGFVVTWESRYDAIRGQIFDADGAKVGDEFVATDSHPGDKTSSTITALTGGGFVVGWFEWGAEVQDEFGNLSPGSRAQVFDASGNKVGTVFPLNSFIIGYQQEPTIAALPSGGFVAAYADNGLDSLQQDTGHRGIWVQIFDSSGNRIGTEIHASTLAPYGQDMPDIEIVPGVGFVVTWRDGNSTDENMGGHLRAQLFDFDGSKIGDEFAVNPGLMSGQMSPDVTVLENGALVFAWENISLNGGADDYDARILFPITHGTEGADSFAGTADRDFYMGHGGTDTINGLAEDDGLSGGDGSDSLDGGAGNDNLDGGAGNDTLHGGSGKDQMDGGSGDDLLDGGTGADDLTGGAGNDSYFIDDPDDRVHEAAGEGTDTVTTTLNYFSLGSNFENLTLIAAGNADGSGNELANILTGNSGANHLFAMEGNDTLHGGGGDDLLDGGAGADHMDGGSGNDQYVVDEVGDVVVENSSEGIDQVFSSVSWTLAANFENLSLEGYDAIDGTGNAGANLIRGNDGSNHLSGLGGNDTIIGGGGNDVIDGGTGVDTLSYIYSSPEGVTVSLAITAAQNTGGAGIDTFTGFENLEGSYFADNLTGDAGANSIRGFDGNDRLDGGAGADKLYGGLGDDTFVVDDINDIISEYTGEGTDLVLSAVTYTLRSGLENMTLTGAVAIDGTGNAVANFLRGNGSANVLDGGSGNDTLYGNGGDDTLVGGSGNDILQGNAGNDTMGGGIGNDIYYVDALGDTVTENASEGTDVVRSSIDYALGANLEDLTLLGAAAIDATGNNVANVIRGNDAANIIDGGSGNDSLYGGGGNDELLGGIGNDQMRGGTGDDSYAVDSTSDRVIEYAGEGADTVYTSVSFTLGSNVENLISLGGNLTGTGNSLDNVMTSNNAANIILHGMAGNDQLVGMSFDDRLDGGDGNDTLTGAFGSDTLTGGNGADTLIGGAGRDTMTGGADNDTFKFADGEFGGVTRATADRIVDFASGDKIDLSAVDANTGLASDQGFSFLGTGAFTHNAGELRYEQVAGNTYLSGDTNGDGIADFMIKLDGLHTVNASDLVL